jgi:hypothetical protein
LRQSIRRIREIGGTAVIAEDEEPEVRGEVQQRGWRFSILKLFSRYFFISLLENALLKRKVWKRSSRRIIRFIR